MPSTPARIFRIGRSRTGLGLFATSPIRKKQPIVEYSGPRIPTPEAQARERKRGHRYMFELDSKWTIDGSVRSNLARYANHACRPNAEAYSSRGRLMLRAIRAIATGEEITYDYGREYLDLFLGKSGCRCATCRARRAFRKSRYRS
jgi:SET domain-containing protein